MNMFQVSEYVYGENRPIVNYFTTKLKAKEYLKNRRGNIEQVNISCLKKKNAFDGMKWEDIAVLMKR